MKLIVFGATGRVGQHFVRLAVEAGHDVTAYARTPEKLQTAGVRTIQGNAFDAKAVAEAIVGHDAVISCVGSSTGMKRSHELEQMGRAIADGMEKAGVKRLVYCASAGVDGEIPGIPGKLMMFMLKNPLADHRNALNYYKTKNITYTIARPMGLKDTPFNPNYVEAFDGVPKGSNSIPRESVAHFMLKALTNKKYDNASVGLAG